MGNEYHKIQSVFKRDETGRFTGEFSRWEFAYLRGNDWIGTEKVDGTNVRLNVGLVRGKTDKAQLHGDLINACLPYVDSAIWREVFDIEGETIHADFTLYGEGYGAGIQKGGHYRPDKAFVLFDVYYNGREGGREGGMWLSREDVEDIAGKFGMPVVPILAFSSLDSCVELIKDGRFKDSFLHPGAQNEGMVLRPKIELRGRRGERIITKLKYKDFT